MAVSINKKLLKLLLPLFIAFGNVLSPYAEEEPVEETPTEDVYSEAETVQNEDSENKETPAPSEEAEAENKETDVVVSAEESSENTDDSAQSDQVSEDTEAQTDKVEPFTVTDVSTGMLTEYVSRINEYLQSETDEEGVKHLIDRIVSSYSVVINEEDNETPLVFETEIDGFDQEYRLFYLGEDAVEEMFYSVNEENSNLISFEIVNGDYLLVHVRSEAKYENTPVDILAPGTVISIQSGTQIPSGLTVDEIENSDEVLSAVYEFVSPLKREVSNIISMKKIGFDANDSINPVLINETDSNTGEQTQSIKSGTVYFAASNIDIDLSQIPYIETIWVSENLDEVKFVPHSMFGNDIYFDLRNEGYLIIAEMQWVSEPVTETQSTLYGIWLKYKKAVGLSGTSMLASATTSNNTTVTINWSGDTVGSRASAASVHIIHGILTVNGESPDSTGNVDVGCVYGSEASTSSTCFEVNADVPANVNWTELNGQAARIAALKQQLGMN